MNCPNCGTLNASTNRFCLKCGQELPVPPPPPPAPAPIPKDSASQAVIIGGISGIISGVLIIIGWFMPWIAGSGLVNTVLNLFGLGSGFGILNFGTGLGNGLQISLLMIMAGFAALGSGDTAILGLLAFIIACVFISLPIMGFFNIRKGYKSIEMKPSRENEKHQNISIIYKNLNYIRGNSVAIIVIMVILFIILSIIPFGVMVLGRAFYLTILGALCGFVGVFIAQRMLPPQNN